MCFAIAFIYAFDTLLMPFIFFAAAFASFAMPLQRQSRFADIFTLDNKMAVAYKAADCRLLLPTQREQESRHQQNGTTLSMPAVLCAYALRFSMRHARAAAAISRHVAATR